MSAAADCVRRRRHHHLHQAVSGGKGRAMRLRPALATTSYTRPPPAEKAELCVYALRSPPPLTPGRLGRKRQSYAFTPCARHRLLHQAASGGRGLDNAILFDILLIRYRSTYLYVKGGADVTGRV